MSCLHSLLSSTHYHNHLPACLHHCLNNYHFTIIIIMFVCIHYCHQFTIIIIFQPSFIFVLIINYHHNHHVPSSFSGRSQLVQHHRFIRHFGSGICNRHLGCCFFPGFFLNFWRIARHDPSETIKGICNKHVQTSLNNNSSHDHNH